jgi:outer membrane protein OmpA-like peptidoglycan-associated protein
MNNNKNILVLITLIATASCQTQPHSYPQSFSAQDNPLPAKNAFVKPLDLKELPDTIRTEHEDRINRLARLSRQFGVQAPRREDLQVAPGTVLGENYPIPVIRTSYEERTFFDFNKADIRPESGNILDVMAEQMNRDLPDTSLVILGHTDSVGTDGYNAQLSLRRAAAVMSELAKRGVNTEQMSTVSIGESQPIATNATEQGRGLNRRVEFMLSRFAEANYVAIEQFPRNSAWLNNHATDQTTVIDSKPKTLVVLKLSKAKAISSSPKKPVNTLKNKQKNIKPTIVQPTVVLPLQESTRIVTLLPAVKQTVDLLPNS